MAVVEIRGEKYDAYMGSVVDAHTDSLVYAHTGSVVYAHKGTRVVLGLISPDVSPSQGAADIRLMAAASELLDALKTLRAHADLFEIFRDDIGQAVEEAVNAAIAKATGKVSELSPAQVAPILWEFIQSQEA